MNNLIILFIFVPILSLILLGLNFLFAVHRPDEQKVSAYECGYNVILGQTRSVFHIHFYVVAMLFLIFDLEILLIYPYTISAYYNNIYGLIIMLIFFILLTAGLVYELGKKALNIYSRQYEN